MPFLRPRALLAAALVVLPAEARAADPPPVAVASPAGGPVKLDGRLDEADWAGVPSIGALTQTEPEEGARPNEATEVRVLRDDETLCFGIRCFDRSPSGIAATKMGRDADLGGDDHMMVVLDTFGDRRNGFFLAVNPRGARAEGQISNNSEELNFDWDGIWDAAARVDGEGWAAELAIPFNRAAAGDRSVDRGAPRRLDLEPVRGGAPRGALRRAAGKGPRRPPLPLRRRGGRRGRGQGRRRRLQEPHAEPHRLAHCQHRLRGDGGGRPPFFLEGAGIYEIAGLGHSNEDLLPFYSRRIGLYQGEEVPILAGLKLSGRVERWNVGLLDVETGRVDDLGLDRQNLLAARLSRNLFRQSFVGALVTHGDPSGTGSNSLAGVDARFATSTFRGGENLSLDLFAFVTDDEASGQKGHAWGGQARLPERPLGRGPHLQGDRRRLPARPRLRAADGDPQDEREGGLHAPPRAARDPTALPRGIAAVRHGHRRAHARLDGARQAPGLLDRVGRHGAARMGPAVRAPRRALRDPAGHRHPRGRLPLHGLDRRDRDRRAPPVGGGGGSPLWELLRRRPHEDRVPARPQARPQVLVGLEGEWSRGGLPGGRFTAKVLAGRFELNFSPDLGWSNLVQYDSDSRELGFQSRLRWRVRPGSDVFVVFNRGWVHEEDGVYRPYFDRGSAKVQHTFRF